MISIFCKFNARSKGNRETDNRGLMINQTEIKHHLILVTQF